MQCQMVSSSFWRKTESYVIIFYVTKKLLLFVFLLLINVSAFAFDQINLTFTQPQNTPYFLGQPEINIDAEEFTIIILSIKSNKSGTARIFWASSYDPQMNEPKSIRFFLNKGSREYIFNVKSQNAYWMGFIGQLLIYPENGPEAIEILRAKAVTGNLITNIKSGWQEFWGPRGRLVVGHTINTIQSSNLFGRSIFVYIYWILGIIAGTALLFKRHETGKIVFLSIIFFWILLEISSSYNHSLQFRQDLKYLGKSPTEKLILANTGDFYPFIRFCEKNIPENAYFDYRIPPIYNDIKARYYLYPRKTQKGGEYLIVYDAKVGPEIIASYSSWKTFRDGATIMKRTKK